MLSKLTAKSARFNTDHAHGSVLKRRVKHADRIRTAAHTGDQTVRQAAFLFQNLRARLASNHTLKVAHHHRIRMRAERAAEQVITVGNIRYPITQRLVDGILQSARSGIYLADLSTEQLHAKDIQRLPPHIFRAHIYDALQSEECTDRGRCNPVLTRAGFRDDALLAHAPRQQNLSQRVVNFVRACVEEVLTLEINSRATTMLRETSREEQRRGPAGVIMKQPIQLAVKCRVVPR